MLIYLIDFDKATLYLSRLSVGRARCRMWTRFTVEQNSIKNVLSKTKKNFKLNYSELFLIKTFKVYAQYTFEAIVASDHIENWLSSISKEIVNKKIYTLFQKLHPHYGYHIRLFYELLYSSFMCMCVRPTCLLFLKKFF